MDLVVGLFVGGRASRMGGAAKGLLAAPDGQPILARTRALFEALPVAVRCVLVGRHASYAEVAPDLPTLDDDPRATGPLAGLLALLAHSGAEGARGAVAVACDMPLLSRELAEKLVGAPPAPVVAPRRRTERGLLWDPLFARYEVVSVLPAAVRFAAAGGRKLQALLDEIGAATLELDPADEAALVDWDTPEDLLRGRA